MLETISVLFLGAGIGLVSGFLGLGGGILIVPLLPMVLPLGYHDVVGTSLFTILLVVLNNTIQFSRAGLVVWRVAAVMGPLTAIMAYTSAKLGLNMDPVLLTYVLAATYFCMASWTLFTRQPKVELANEKLTLFAYSMALVAALIAGTLSGLTGIGSGMILGAFLLNMKVLPNVKLSPTANAIMVFTCLAGVLAYGQLPTESDWIWGYVHLDVALNLFVGAFVTSYFSRKYQHKLPVHVRKYILGVLLLALGVKVL